MKKIGIVGLGIMGRGMADNFLKNGYEVYLWNRTESVSQAFKQPNAHICATPKAVTQESDIVFEVTANDESSHDVWYGKDGILVGSSIDKILITSATLSIDYTDKLIKDAQSKGLTILDIPLTGGRVGAETGNLTLLCGGPEDVIKDLSKEFDAIAGTVFHFGPAGHGMRYKLILNFIQGTHLVAFAQSMRIAEKENMNLEKVAEALSNRPGGAITGIAAKSYFKQPEPITFSVEWITKDLSYASKLAKGLDLSLLKDVLKTYESAIVEGKKDKDWSVVVQ